MRAGHEVALLDFRGHGRSGGRRWYVDRFEDYLADLDAFAATVRAGAAGRKIFVVAHSQGGHIAAHWALRGGRSVDGVVLSNPYFRLAIDPPKVKVWSALLIGKIIPHLPVDAGLDLATLTSDPEMQAWSDADPLYQRKATPRWFTESGRAQDDLRRDMARFDRPLLLLLGTGDRIADGAAGAEFFAAVGLEGQDAEGVRRVRARDLQRARACRPHRRRGGLDLRAERPRNALTGARARLLS